MNRLALALLALTAATLAAPVEALSHCTTSAPEVDTGATAAGRYYIDNDVCDPACDGSFYVYRESNNIAGLQRGDAHRDDTQKGLCYPSDHIVL